MNFTTPSSTNFTTNCVNCTDISVNEFPESLRQIEIKILSAILLISLCGNILLITAITRYRQLRNEANYLILNLACCDLIAALFSIPFTLIIRSSISYPLHQIGCKIIWPLATYGSDASVLTLVCIAIERYLAISGTRIQLTKRRIFFLLLFIHLIALGSALPYSYHLIFEKYEGLNYCYEDWVGTPEQKSYTITLFLLQYGLPLPIMTVLYSSAWWKIKQQNKIMIEMSEEYERKMNWEHEDRVREHDTEVSLKETTVTFQEGTKNSLVSVASEAVEDDEKSKLTNGGADRRGSAPVLNSPGIPKPLLGKCSSLPTGTPTPGLQTFNNNMEERSSPGRSSIIGTLKRIDTLSTIRRKINHFRKPAYVSQTAYLRHRQTVRTLKMFTMIVVVFLIFALPNQIRWLMKDFAPLDKQPPLIAQFVFHILTYVNSMVNCWIYGGFNKSFRKAYKQILSFVTCKDENINTFRNRSRASTNTSLLSRTTTPSSYYNESQKERFESRHDAFDDMFDDHLNHFEKFQHLYQFDEEDVKEEKTLIQQSQKKRKLTLSNLLNVLTPSSRKTSSLSLSSTAPEKKSPTRKFSLLPPIIPFTQKAGSPNGALTERKRRASTSEIGALKKMQFLHSISATGSMVNSLDIRSSFDGSIMNFDESRRPTRKTSVWDKLTSPKIFRQKVQKSSMENEIPTIKVFSEGEVSIEEVAIEEVKTVETCVVRTVRKKNIKQPISYTKLKQQKEVKQSPRKARMQTEKTYEQQQVATATSSLVAKQPEPVTNKNDCDMSSSPKMSNISKTHTQPVHSHDNVHRKPFITVDNASHENKGKKPARLRKYGNVYGKTGNVSVPHVQIKATDFMQKINNEQIEVPKTERRPSVKELMQNELVFKRTAMSLKSNSLDNKANEKTQQTKQKRIQSRQPLNQIENMRKKQSETKVDDLLNTIHEDEEDENNLLNTIHQDEEDVDNHKYRTVFSEPTTPLKCATQNTDVVLKAKRATFSPPTFKRETSLTAHVFARTGVKL